jgi:hypothetical protein
LEMSVWRFDISVVETKMNVKYQVVSGHTKLQGTTESSNIVS